MSLYDNKRLYDVATRKQLYIERVKIQHQREFNAVLIVLSIELRKIFSRVSQTKLDDLTKAELNRLLITVREAQGRIYSAYSDKLLQQLRDFLSADLEVTRRTLAPVVQAALSDNDNFVVMTDDEAIAYMQERVADRQEPPLYPIAALTGNNDRMWASVMAAPIPANGLYILPFLKNFTTSAATGVENLIRKGYANGQTVDETIIEIIGSDNKQGYTGHLQKVSTQGAAVVATTFQHVAGMVSAGVASTMMSGYLWASILDSRTTEVCKERHNKAFRYGNGPLPPAHIRCRSHISPLIGAELYLATSLSNWASDQSDEFLEDFFEEEDEDDIQEEIVSSETLALQISSFPLTLAEYRNKIQLILSR